MSHRDNFNDASKERIDNAFSTTYDYEGTKLVDETPEEFTERCINRYMEEVVEGVERAQAEDAARLSHKEDFQSLS
tara:strand:- start:1821 stop:2048 length:228 start_codon:yes stop_codon:yes gene_type:complete